MYKTTVLWLLTSVFCVLLSGCCSGKTACCKSEDPYTKLLCDLIKIRPVTSDTAAVNKAQAMMMKFLSERGIYCTMERHGDRNVLFAASSPGKVQDYILCTHLDVVPAIDEKQYEPVIKDGVIYGRGTSDCLGSSVAAAKLLCSLPKGKKVGCIFTSDEEVGGSTTAFMVNKGYKAVKSAIVIDSSGIIYGQKGILNLKVTAHGKGGHSSAPWNCDNPVIKLVNGLHRISEKWQNPANAKDWRTSLAITVIQAGDVINRIPEKAEALLNFRFTKIEEIDKIVDFIKKESGLEVTVLRISDPFETNPDLPEIQKAVKAYNRAFNKNIKPKRICGATDARHIYKMGCPTFATGVNGRGAHGANERLELASIDYMVSMVLELVDAPAKL